jgi:hypothetical protein
VAVYRQDHLTVYVNPRYLQGQTNVLFITSQAHPHYLQGQTNVPFITSQAHPHYLQGQTNVLFITPQAHPHYLQGQTNVLFITSQTHPHYLQGQVSSYQFTCTATLPAGPNQCPVSADIKSCRYMTLDETIKIFARRISSIDDDDGNNNNNFIYSWESNWSHELLSYLQHRIPYKLLERQNFSLLTAQSSVY